jgi:hypothetical protein
MLNEYDTISLKTPLVEAAIPVGSKGIILMVFEFPSKAYEVEFFDVTNRSLGTFTVTEDQIEYRDMHLK